MVKRLPAMRETLGSIPRSREDPLEKEMASHCSTLAWKIPWMKEPGRLQSMGSQSRTWLSNFTFTFFQSTTQIHFLLPHTDLWISDFNDLTLICFCFLFLFLWMQIWLVIKAKWFNISIQFSRSVMSDSLWLHGLQHTGLPCPSPTHGPCSNSCPLSQWCHPTIPFSVIPFSYLLQSFLASRSFQMSLFFTSGGQSIGVSSLTSVLPMNIQNWFPLEWTGCISLLSKGLSRVFSNTTVQKIYH